MLKRLFISFFLLLAFAIVQAHDYIPHDHHTEQEDPFEHHDHEHGSNDNDGHDFLHHAFAHLQHEQGSAFSYEYSQKYHIEHKASFIRDYTSFLTTFILTFFNKEQPVYLPQGYSVPLQRGLLYFDLPRRGPPVLTA